MPSLLSREVQHAPSVQVPHKHAAIFSNHFKIEENGRQFLSAKFENELDEYFT